VRDKKYYYLDSNLKECQLKSDSVVYLKGMLLCKNKKDITIEIPKYNFIDTVEKNTHVQLLGDTVYAILSKDSLWLLFDTHGIFDTIPSSAQCNVIASFSDGVIRYYTGTLIHHNGTMKFPSNGCVACGYYDISKCSMINAPYYRDGLDFSDGITAAVFMNSVVIFDKNGYGFNFLSINKPCYNIGRW
jgi:hypothetical protein